MIKEYIKKIGTGPHGVRDLTRQEASDAASILLSGAATPSQIGALLLGLRLKGETGDETGGFLDALREKLPPSSTGFDLDVGDPYDGKSRSLSLVVPAAIAAADLGLRVVLHGLPGVPVKQGPGVVDAWKELGGRTSSPSEVESTEDSGRVICLSQELFLPGLSHMLQIRQELGLRTLWNTVEKSVNPLGARAQIIGVFHEPVIEKLRTALNSSQSARAGRILFVMGLEGGVDLYTHRATTCYLFDSSLGENLHPVTIPPPLEQVGPLPPLVDKTSLPSFLGELSQNPGHPTGVHLKRQTALFLFAAGKFKTFMEAEKSLHESYSAGIPVTFSSPRSRP